MGLVLGHYVGLDGNDMAIDWVMIFFFMGGDTISFIVKICMKLHKAWSVELRSHQDMNCLKA